MMFSIVALIIIVAILIPALFVVASAVQSFDEGDGEDAAESASDRDGSRGVVATAPQPPPQPAPEGPREPDALRYADLHPLPLPVNRGFQTPVYKPPQATPHGAEQNRWRGDPRQPIDGTDRVETDRRRSRPTTPVHNNHFRPATPLRPPTPVASGGRQPNTAAAQGAASDQTKAFVRFHELSADERRSAVDLSQCTVYVSRKILDPLLDSIKRKATDVRTLEHVIAYFNKKDDKQLSPYEKRIRKSFKIKDERSDLCRYARLKISTMDSNYWVLKFHDYTPYLEAHAPKFDAFRQEVSKERSRWETVEAQVYHNTQLINATSLSVLVPGAK